MKSRTQPALGRTTPCPNLIVVQPPPRFPLRFRSSGALLFHRPTTHHSSLIAPMKSLLLASLLTLAIAPLGAQAEEAQKLAVGQQAPAFKIKDSAGKAIALAALTADGPVLVRLTCGCLGCNKELPYFQELHAAYQDKGLTSLAVFREPDAKVEAYVKEKKLNMLYAVDPKGESWKVFQTTTMPSNFL